MNQNECRCCCFTLKFTNTGKESLKVILDHLPNPCPDIYFPTFHNKYTQNDHETLPEVGRQQWLYVAWKHGVLGEEPLLMTGRVDE